MPITTIDNSNNTLITNAILTMGGIPAHKHNSQITSTNWTNMIEFIEFAFSILGINLTYEDFEKMSKEERKSFLRDLKLNKIL